MVSVFCLLLGGVLTSVLAEESMKFVGKGFAIQERLKLPLSCAPDVITMVNLERIK